MSVNTFKLFLYTMVAMWLFLYLKTLDVTEVDTANSFLLNFSSALNNNILIITATIAILEVIAHVFSFDSIIKGRSETINKLDEYEEKQRKRELELMFKKSKG